MVTCPVLVTWQLLGAVEVGIERVPHPFVREFGYGERHG